MHPTDNTDLNAVLAQLVTANQALLAGNFVGAYLHGSFAVGDPDEASDVDYMIVVRHEVADDQVQVVEAACLDHGGKPTSVLERHAELALEFENRL